MRATAFLLVLSMVLLSTEALADVPGLMNFQGALTDENGNALDTTVSMTFSIYTDSTGGTQVWTETQPAVVVNSGIFNVLLGRVSSIPDTVFSTLARWLAVQVGSDPEMQPRQQIAAVGYAFQAVEADTADYARSAPPLDDGDWTVFGAHMYSAVSGSVGIGTASPEAKLDVNGEVNAGSLYKIAGDAVLSTPGTHNTFVGIRAGTNNSGSFGTFVGYEAGVNNQGMGNTFLGNSPGFTNTTGNYNTFLGADVAGGLTTTGSSNTFVGHSAGYLNTTGDYNTFVGLGAGYQNSTGSRNVFIGYLAGYSETDSNKLYIANGASASDVLMYGDFSTGRVGLGTLSPAERLHVVGNVTVEDTLFASHLSSHSPLHLQIARTTRMYIDTTGNVAIGTTSPAERLDVAGTALMTGFKLPPGAVAGYVLTSDSSGAGSWQPSPAVADSVMYADSSAYADIAGYAPMPDSVMYADSSAYADVAGYAPMPDSVVHAVSADTADYALLADSATTAAYAHVAGYAPTLDSVVHAVSADTADYAVLADSATTAAYAHVAGSTIIPDSVAYADSAGADGDWTVSGAHMYSSVPGSVGIGTTNPEAKLDVNGEINAGTLYKIAGEAVLSTPGTHNTFVGIRAGTNNSGSFTTFVGYEAGFNNQGMGNTFLGNSPGFANTTGNYNTFLGADVAGGLTTTGGLNTFLGHSAGYQSTTGDYNTFVGLGAGYQNSTGSRNVFIGYLAGYSETDSDKLYIANGANVSDVLIYGDFSTGKVGLGTLSPAERLHVAGNVTVEDTLFASNISSHSPLQLQTQGTTHMYIDTTGNVAIATPNPTAKLDVNGATGYDQLRLRTSFTPVDSTDANGNVGDIAWDDDYVYIKTSQSWKRAALSTF